MLFWTLNVTEKDWAGDFTDLVGKLRLIAKKMAEPSRPPLIESWPFALAVQSTGRWRPKAKVFRKGGVPTVLLMAFAGFHFCVSIPSWARRWL